MSQAQKMTPPLSPILFAGMALRPVPRVLLQAVLDVVMMIVRRRHPDIFERLGELENPTFLIDPIDLPHVFELFPDTQAPRLVVHGRGRAPSCKAVIRGPLTALLDLLQGRIDGDALFFSRDLSIEGDTEAVVALRNAVDGAEIDIDGDIRALFGPLARPLAGLKRIADGIVSRVASDLRILHDAAIAPPMRRLDAQDARLRTLSDRLVDVEKSARRRKPQTP